MKIIVYALEGEIENGMKYEIVIDEVEMIRFLRMMQNKVKTSGIIWE